MNYLKESPENIVNSLFEGKAPTGFKRFTADDTNEWAGADNLPDGKPLIVQYETSGVTISLIVAAAENKPNEIYTTVNVNGGNFTFWIGPTFKASELDKAFNYADVLNRAVKKIVNIDLNEDDAISLIQKRIENKFKLKKQR